MLTRPIFPPSLLAVLGALAACTPGEAVRPKDPTYAGAVGESGGQCTSVGEEGKPLVVDWKPEERSDLEAALAQGVAIVHYDCQGIKLLPDCHLDGGYGYVGTTTQEQVISLDNADEVKANLPLNGPKISASLARDASLDIGMLLIGKRTTTALKVRRDTLTGRCDGATHFVRDATIGGFAMKTGTVGKAGAAVDVFGRGGSVSSESNKSVSTRSGDVEACRHADVDAPKPPAQCGAPVRIRLLAISSESSASVAAAEPVRAGKPSPGARPAASKAKVSTDELDALLASLECPAGMVYAQGKCARQAAVHTCAKTDAAECAKMCDAGDAPSCANLGSMYHRGTGGTAKDPGKARQYLDKACRAGQTRACYELGNNYVGQEPVSYPREAAFMMGCAFGDAESCNQEATCLEEGEGVPKDQQKAIGLYIRACSAGSRAACENVGTTFLSGLGVPRDEDRGLGFIERACFGGKYAACLGGDSDAEMKRNHARHLKMAEFACRSGYTGGCTEAAEAYAPGGYAPPNPAKVAELRGKACALNKSACGKK
jgi:hypothetical protein